MPSYALFLLISATALVLILLGLTVYLIYQRKLTRLQQTRFDKYLSQNASSLAQTQEQSLFKADLQQQGIKGWAKRLSIRFEDVLSPKLVAVYLAVSASSIFIVLWLGPDWSLTWQVFSLILVNLLALNFLYQREVKRLAEEFEQDFPHAVATVSRAVSAGLSLNAALVQAKQQSRGRVQQVFTEITDLQAIGATLEQALAQAGIKIQQPSFKFFSVCLLLNEQSGGQLAQVLHQLMSNMHERKSHDKKVLAMTAEPRMSAKVIAVLPVAFLFLFYFKLPSAFDYLRDHSTGQWIAGYAFVSIVFGLWLINKMTKVD